MLRFDRYLLGRSRALDLTSGNVVALERTRADSAAMLPLFTSRSGRTLIDIEPATSGRIEIWEPWVPKRAPRGLHETVMTFIEVLECARLGAPRAFDLVARRSIDRQYLRRALAREARLRGFIPIAVELLASLTSRPSTRAVSERSHPSTRCRSLRAGRAGRGHQWPMWIADRSLVVFAETSGLSGDAVIALLQLAQRDARPHVLVRSLVDAGGGWLFPGACASPPMVHEAVVRYGAGLKADTHDGGGISVEAAARWALMLEELIGGAGRSVRTLDLAEVLIAREQPFEASALLARVRDPAPEVAARQLEVSGQLEKRAAGRAGRRLAEHFGTSREVGGWDMVDDFVGLLQICQDIEDEQAALSRVGAYLRERLQASTVAFVARESGGPRVLSRVGSESARLDLAVRTIESGVGIPAGQAEGPVESAWPVRHAAEVIGAVWCRWSAGTPVATHQAATLLGIAAAAAAPSVRLAIARHQVVAAGPNPVPELVGQSPAIGAVRDAIVRAAASPFPVVIEGESGSGKELAARAIHARSVRRDKRFCAINCAALVDDLVEAELFGHTRGAFTGAATDRAGLFEEASGGTVFLDETAELGPRVQAKLLRTLQEGEIRRLGEAIVRRVDVRIVAATNRPLALEVDAGRFRKDLWYRLDVIRITLPPLRARLEDLPVLATHIWQALASRTGSQAVLSPAAIAALTTYDWPGNVRELQNVLSSLLVAAPPTGVVGPAALPGHIARAAAFEQAATLTAARRQFDERYVRAALARAGGQTVVAARELGLTRQGLSKLMGRLGIVLGS